MKKIKLICSVVEHFRFCAVINVMFVTYCMNKNIVSKSKFGEKTQFPLLLCDYFDPII